MRISLLILVFFVSCAKAQFSTIYICSSESRLPFASLVDLKSKTQFTSDQNGIVNLIGSVGDSFKICYLGFRPCIYSLKAKKSDTVTLIQDFKLLSEITITNCRKFSNYEISNYSKNKKRPGFEFYGYTTDQTTYPLIFATLLRSEKLSQLKNFTFWLVSHSYAPDSAIKNPVLISFYSVSDSLTPGVSIMNKSILYYPKKEGEQLVNIDSFRISIDTTGIFLCIQLLQDERYSWIYKVESNDGIDYSHKSYGGMLLKRKNSLFLTLASDVFNNNWIKIDPLKLSVNLSKCDY
jgi:hypothetical protein